MALSGIGAGRPAGTDRDSAARRGLFGTDSSVKTSQLDLTLVGPDGNPRSFELFWKGDTGLRSVALKPSRLLFDKKRMLVWEPTARRI